MSIGGTSGTVLGLCAATVLEDSPQPSTVFNGGDAIAFSIDGNYIPDGSGRFVGWTAVQEKVYIAVRTIQSSSAVDSFGLEPMPLLMTDGFEYAVQKNIEACLAALVKAKEIKIRKVVVRKGDNGRAFVQVDWTDLAAQSLHSTTI
jgi:hypothetical protein